MTGDWAAVLVRVTKRIDEAIAPEPAGGVAHRVLSLARDIRKRLEQPRSLPNGGPPAPAKPPLVFKGIYFGEDGSDRNGIWTADEFSLPVPLHGPGTLHFKAFHPESLFLKQEAALAEAAPDGAAAPAGPPVTSVTFRLGDVEAGSYLVDGEGDFEIDVPLEAAGPSVAILDVIVSRSFSPLVIWQSADKRRLGLLLKLVSVDGLEIVNNTAQRASLPLEDIVTHVPGINVIGYLKAEMGLGESARSCVKSALAHGIAASTLDVGFQALHRQEGGEAADATAGPVRPVNIIHVNAEQCRSLWTFLADEKPDYLRAGYSIGFWHWEQPDFPTDYLPCFDGFDEIWTPSSFVQASISAISPVPVLRMPHAVTAAASPGARREHFGLPDGLFLTLVTYDFYSYQHRKNPQAAIAAYREAAASGAPLGLVIKTMNGDKVPAALDELQRELAGLGNVFVIDRYLSRQEMFDLEACCDCLLSLHRAEGFGLGLAEMMCLGKPVIATNWSGNADFMTTENSMPVGYELMPLASDIGPYRAGSLWAEANAHHAAECLLRLANDRALGAALGERAQADMAKNYSPEAIGKLYRRRLAIIEVTRRLGENPSLDTLQRA